MSQLQSSAEYASPGDLMKVSTTSSQTDETNVSQSTVITVRLFGNDENGRKPRNGRRSELLDEQSLGDSQRQKAETLVTDVIVVRHPRSMLILAVLLLVIGLQLLVIGAICIIYDAPLYVSGLWFGLLFVAQAVLGVLIVKRYPRRCLIVVLLVVSAICCPLAICLFALTLHESWQQREILQNPDSHPHKRQPFSKIVEETIAALLIVQSILAAAHAAASLIMIILCIINVRQPAKEQRRAFYIADDQLGHQLVLVPVKLHTGTDIDSWLNEAAAAASSATLAQYSRPNYPSPYSTLGSSPYHSYNRWTGTGSNTATLTATIRSSKAVQTNVTFGT